MDQERWRSIKSILADALAVDVSQRPAFVAKACEGDTDLEREVSELLEGSDDAADPFETPAADSFLLAARSRMIGSRIGKYKVLSELGAGGMGAVYLAERADGAFEQQVALKLIRTGLKADETLSRFVNERQILASLHHDGIAHLIDGGTTGSGDPYLVMEYVDGVPITDYTGQRHLALKERLDLFLEVCSAVSYAHQNLVIHRDLKPSNILVTADGSTKLLDFGIAKILADSPQSDVTLTKRFVFTPDYASPEQVLGNNLTTASDVYSLGVILYELLTDRRPYRTDSGNITEIVKSVCHTEPAPPSKPRTAKQGDQATGQSEPVPRALIKGDLDSIVLKALRKTPEHRYPSVEALSEDLKCYIAGQPVSARSGTFRYKAKKFVQRHRLSVGAGSLLLLALIAGIGATVYQARIAQRERAVAERRFNDLRQLANSFVFEVNDEIERSPIKARELLVERSIRYLDEMSKESGTDESLIAELAAAYDKVGDVQSELFQSNLGNSAGSLQSHLKALDLRQKLLERSPNDLNRMLDVVRSHEKVGNLLTVTGDISGALDHYRTAVHIAEEAAAAQPNSYDAQTAMALSYILLGQATLRSGSLNETESDYNQAYAIYQGLLGREPENADVIRRIAVTHSYMGYVEIQMGKFDSAVDHLRNAALLDQKLLDSDSTNSKYQDDVNTDQLWMGIGLREAGHPEESQEYVERSIQFQLRMVARDPNNVGLKNGLADCYLELGQGFAKEGKFAAAAKQFSTALDIYQMVSAQDGNDLSARLQTGMSRRMRADALLSQGKKEEAARDYAVAAQTIEELVAKDPNNLDWQYELALARMGNGRSTASSRKNAGADELNSAKSICQMLLERSPTNVRYVRLQRELQQTLR